MGAHFITPCKIHSLSQSGLICNQLTCTSSSGSFDFSDSAVELMYLIMLNLGLCFTQGGQEGGGGWGVGVMEGEFTFCYLLFM